MTGPAANPPSLDPPSLGREAVQAWLADHPAPSGADLAAAGLVAPHWPAPWGRGASVDERVVVEEELVRAGVALPDNPIGIGWAGPTLLAAGTAEQQADHLPGILDGSAVWCQLFSEPDAGSDLASLSTRAVRDGDRWVVTGQKIWTTSADVARFGILLARTDPDAPRHRGISYFICPMDRPGVEVRRIREMSGGHHFCEVFLDDVELPVDALVGAAGDGWRLARITLANERVSLSSGGILWGMGPTGREVLDLLARRGVADPLLRQRWARLHSEAVVLDLLGRRVLDQVRSGGAPGPDASLQKLLADEHGQRLLELLADVAGPDALLDSPSPWPRPMAGEDPPVGAGLGSTHQGRWPWSLLFSRALTIGGGTTQVQRNILAEQVLGLPPGGGRLSGDDEPIEDGDWERLRFERDGDVLVVIIDHPGSPVNAVDAVMHHELARLFRGLRRESAARAVLLTGSGRAFCAGGDLDWFPQLRSPEALDALRRDARQMIWDLLDVELPIVCGLNGHAMGLGASIALLCDLVVASSVARIGDPHVKVGLVAGDGGTVIWPLVLGPARAKEHLLLGEPLDATDAERLGLVNRVVAPERVHDESLDLARRLAAGAPLAVRATKLAVNQQLRAALLASFDTATALELATFHSADHAEGVRAAREGRPARFEGR